MMRFFWLPIFGVAVFLGAAQGEDVQTVTLDQAQATAVAQNQMVQAARAGVDGARAKKFQTWAGHLPTVRLSESATRSNDAVNAFGFRLKQERFAQANFAVGALNDPAAISNFQTKLEILQPLFNGGQSLYGRRAASAGVRAALADYERGVQDVRYQTARAYWGVVLAREALLAVQQGLETARVHAQAADARFREEATDLSDVLAARVRVAELEGEEIAARNRVAEAIDGLALVTGLPIGTQLNPSDELTRRPVPQNLDELIAKAQVARPDLMANRAREKAARQGVGVARASVIPHVNAFAEIALDTDEMFTRKGESWMAGAMLTWELFSGGKSIGAVREARAAHEGARAMATFKASDVVREVRAAFRAVSAGDAQVDIAEDALKHAEERLRITQLQYREGLATSIDVLTAESELRRTRVRRLQALYALNVGLAKLELAVGEPFGTQRR